jgi:glycosyltransferase involved in cell wall biosynthesis
MRIHIFAASVRFSGGRQVLFGHVNELARRGHDVALWIDAPEPRIDWMSLNVPMHSLAQVSLRQLPSCDVALFDRPRLARPLWRQRHAPVVHFCQGYERLDVDNRLTELLRDNRRWRRLPELWKLWRKRREIEQAYRTPTIKIVVHAPLRDLLARLYGQLAYLVPNGLPAGIFTPPPQRSFQAQNILVVGSSDTACKRIGDALEAVRLLKQTRPGVRLIRVSSHPMRPAEQAVGVTDEYHTMLKPAAMADIYRRADILAFPSDANEGFGLPALEALACGTPVVLSDIPALRGFAVPVDYAHFVPVGCPAQLAETLGRLLDDEAERRRLSARGPEVAGAFSLERSYQAMEDTLLTIVRRSRPFAA